MLQKFNYRHNCTVPLPHSTVINGQGCGEVAKMKYGLCNMSFNGCEMIALHNSMVLMGKNSDLKEICKEMYPKSQMLSGIFGSNPCLLGSFYKKRNFLFRKTYRYTEFFDSLESTTVAVLSFWNKKKPFNGLHTVTVQAIDGKIRVYNRYNNRDYPYDYISRTELLPKKSDFICGYLIYSNSTNSKESSL
ncbi:MAG: hypothetical protein IIX98_06920 [Clostridia bacterium]|jgi:hypothetical protein|nr:hypothetical protein [Clostridia bacterium]